MIEVEALTKRFGTTWAPHEVSLIVGAGQVLALLVPNGAAKTTLVRVFTRLLRADSWRARVTGLDVWANAKTIRSVIGLARVLEPVPEGHRVIARSAWPLGKGPRHRKVEDVMTATVVTADPLTPYKEVARLLAEHQISGMPVLLAGWQVIGVVSEADLLAAQDRSPRAGPIAAVRRIWRRREPGHLSLSAGDLMTAPPVTIGPDATLPAAVRLMNTRHVRRLPVTGADRQLIGIVSRRDLLSVFLRPDTDIADDVRLVLAEIPLTRSASVAVSVRHGVVTLTGTFEAVPGGPGDLVRLIRNVDGVIDVVCTRS